MVRQVAPIVGRRQTVAVTRALVIAIFRSFSGALQQTVVDSGLVVQADNIGKSEVPPSIRPVQRLVQPSAHLFSGEPLMADVYTVSIGHYHTVQDGIHAGMQYFVEWMTLTLIDGPTEVDRWMMNANKSGAYWPDSGEWLKSSGTAALYTADSGSRLASLRVPRWPLTKGSGGEVDIFREVSGRKKGVYYVNNVE